MTEKTRILLIDDDAVDRAIVRRALTASGIGHSLTEASNGSDGLQLARGESFDCVLMDYRLPDADPLALLSELVSSGGGGQAVVVLTGESDQDAAYTLMRAGALDYLSKNETTPSSLARAIRYASARRLFLSELEEARRVAEQKSLALDALNRQKALLLSIIAHDLRNPFQSLLGLSDLMTQAVASKDLDLVARRSQGLKEAAAQAHSLAESLFGWAVLQMDDEDVRFDDVRLDEIIESTLEGAAEAARQKNIEFDAPASGLRVRAHPDMLAAILRNLVSNAVKFSQVGGRVRISSRPNDDKVTIDVEDHGVGMPPEALANLFDFERRRSTLGTAGERGGGLGLLLCHDLVERQGGSMAARSEPGRGSVFSVELRAAA